MHLLVVTVVQGLYSNADPSVCPLLEITVVQLNSFVVILWFFLAK